MHQRWGSCLPSRGSRVPGRACYACVHECPAIEILPRQIPEDNAALVKARGALLAAVAVAALAACGGSESEPPGGLQSSPSTTASTPAAAPEDLAEEVTQHYFDALDRLGAILDQDLEMNGLRDEVGSLKDEYIAVLLPYGRLREEMPDAERDTFDSTVDRAILLSTPPALSKLSATAASLNAAGETSLAEQVASFNIITQYVFFDLLKEQDPLEAQRLGIR